MSTLLSLPFEVAQLIYDSLSYTDRYTLLCVCKDWHHLFHGRFYRSVTISNRNKLRRFIQSIPGLGHHIRELTLRANKMTTKEIGMLQSYGSSIEALHLDWRIWTYWHTLDKTEEGIPRLMIPFLQSFTRLTQLTLDTAWFRNVSLIDIFAHMPRVNDLTLSDIRKTITTAYVESIHKCLPSLHRLVLHGLKAAPGILRESYTPAIHLQTFRLDCFHSSYHPLWLIYFAHKYPSLQHLSFQHILEDKERHEVKRRRQHQEQQCETAFALFARHCRNLKSLGWHAIVPPDVRLFRALADIGTSLDHLSFHQVHDACHHSSKKKEQAEVRDTTWLDIPSLSLSFWTPSLKDFRKLRHLTLRAVTANQDRVDLGTILSSCRQLESLAVDNWDIASSARTMANHPLIRFSAQHCLLADTTIDNLAKTCLNMIHLKLFDCTVSGQNVVSLRLPQHALQSIDIQHLKTSVTQKRIKVFALANEVGRRWYYMTRFKTRQDSQQRMWDEATELTCLDIHTATWVEASYKSPATIPVRTKTIQRKLLRDVLCGYLHLECRSVRLLLVNNRRVCLE
ncbi:hypothetical protein EC973_003412 [Apophysomyces ossiformis]|uniref:F-box domain-containing protein n=1 Tax=Apophysomyces ossiformis TaxID=679940 RepID=A0A8H7BT74_9FUNG|nr:hypothetical protein EC973_003412 [Apophysomyces ossiformis]